MNSKKKKSRNRKARKRIAVIIIVLLFVWWFNNFTLTVSTETVKSDKINDEITIVQISDLHGAQFGKGNSHLIKAVQKQKPDLVFATGDMYTLGENGGMQTALDLMAELAKEFTVYYVNGEHDYAFKSTEFFDSLTASGVNVLNYKDEIITVKNTKLHIYGINNAQYSDTFDLANAFERDEKNYSVLLAHIPNFRKFADFGIDISFCGDTHGGLFRLPVIGAVYDGEDILPELKGKYSKGLYELDGKYMFISSGLGSYPAPVRFLNRPEVCVIKLTPDI